ncbi:MAG TPA: hypothetical protein VHA75_18400, partial [Rugosimonospora sp.]|nr:hypothetical protein [Rugosimonospora sp.]
MSTPRGSRAGRGARIAGAVVTVAALAALTGLVVGRSWQSTADGASDVSAERHGIALLQPLTELVAALTVAQSTAVRGGQIDGTTIRQTSHDVDAADAGYGAGLGTHERWTELRGRIDAVTGNPGTGADAYQRFGDVVGLAVTLLRQAGTAAGLTADPAPERAALADTLLAQVPDVLVYAGRAADLATLAGHPVPASSLAAV